MNPGSSQRCRERWAEHRGGSGADPLAKLARAGGPGEAEVREGGRGPATLGAGVSVGATALVDAAVDDLRWGDGSAATLEEVGRSRRPVLPPIVHAEVPVAFQRLETSMLPGPRPWCPRGAAPGGRLSGRQGRPRLTPPGRARRRFPAS